MINLIIDQTILFHLNKAFKEYGIEGTEQKIKEIYATMPTIKERYLQIYSKVMHNEK